MKLGALGDLINGSIRASDFRADIEAELARHLSDSKKLGGSADVIVEEDIDFELTGSKLAVLCRLNAAGEISADEPAYIADEITLSRRATCESERVFNDLFMCGDPLLNGRLSVGEAIKMAEAYDDA